MLRNITPGIAMMQMSFGDVGNYSVIVEAKNKGHSLIVFYPSRAEILPVNRVGDPFSKITIIPKLL